MVHRSTYPSSGTEGGEESNRKMKCIKCGCELSADMFSGGMCFNCGTSVDESEKIYEDELLQQQLEQERSKQQVMEEKRNAVKMRFCSHMLTTGFSFDGYNITKYIGLVSGETVIGTGYFSNIEASISDIFGVVSTEYSDKIKKAKAIALQDMITESANKGGNAIIGISYDIITFNRDMIGVSVNGTSVTVEK